MESVVTGAVKGLSDEQRLILGKFQRVMAAVDRTRLGRDGGSLSLSFHWNVDPGAVTESNLPPEDELWALSAAIRPLIAKNDNVQFGRICRILQRSGYYPEEDAGVESVRAQWNAALEHHFIKIGEHAPRDLIDLFFNTLYFHPGDPDESEKRERLEAAIGQRFMLCLIAEPIFELVNIARSLRPLVDAVVARDAESRRPAPTT